MGDEELVVIISTSILIGLTLLLKRRKNRSIWVNSYLKRRREKGRYNVDFKDMNDHEPTFKENFHMNISNLEYIYSRIERHLIPKRRTRPDDAIPPKQKLVMVLEYLASGSLQRHISSTYRISKQSFGHILDDVCDAIRYEFEDEVMPPLTNSDWLKKANEFNAIWNFPNCVGTIDGKHIPIKCPDDAGSLFYNYKGFHSIVMMAISDAKYRFLYVDVGGYGSEGDASYFGNSEVGKQIIQDKVSLPADSTISGKKVPYFFIGDGAFPFAKRLMKPFSSRKQTQEETIFNYRLSRARRCVENAFGILTTKWLCLKRTMFCSPDRAQKIVTACIILHNFLLSVNIDSYCPPCYADYYDSNGELVEGSWRQNEVQVFHPLLNNNIGRVIPFGPYEIRDLLKDYVNSPQGAVKWQKRSIYVE